MNKSLKKFLEDLNLSNNEIKDLQNISPMISLISCETFLINCKLLTNYGYPEADLDFLILSNPNIFTRSNTDLKSDLENLSKRYDDIEKALKNNPYII